MTKRHTSRSQKARALASSTGMPYTLALRALDAEQPVEQLPLTLGMLVAECATVPSRQEHCGCWEDEGCAVCEGGGGVGPERYESVLLGGTAVTRYSVLKLADAVGNRWEPAMNQAVVVEHNDKSTATVRIGTRRFLISNSQLDLLELCVSPGCLHGAVGELPCARHLAQHGAEVVLDRAQDWAVGQFGVEIGDERLERYFLYAAHLAGVPRQQVAQVITEGRNRDVQGPEDMGWHDVAAEARAEVEADVERLLQVQLPAYGHDLKP
ncbi:hypothetical protein ACFV6F_12975 [Kitasatospora phosalacinea]|uniref:hypothetical protein n=1 Tax=Kitasatospora phosalacinea TaxID=2065 RepID=UPI0036499D3A